MEIGEMQAIMEAIIYVADDPVKLEQSNEVFPEESEETVKKALSDLVEYFFFVHGLRPLGIGAMRRMGLPAPGIWEPGSDVNRGGKPAYSAVNDRIRNPGEVQTRIRNIRPCRYCSMELEFDPSSEMPD